MNPEVDLEVVELALSFYAHCHAPVEPGEEWEEAELSRVREYLERVLESWTPGDHHTMRLDAALRELVASCLE